MALAVKVGAIILMIRINLNKNVCPRLVIRGCYIQGGIKMVIDWLSYTVKALENNPFQLIGFEREDFFKLSTGFYGYRQQSRLGDIIILENGNQEMGTHTIFTGAGCRQYESMKSNLVEFVPMETVLRKIKKVAKISRLDLAIDYESDGFFQNIEKAIKESLYVSRWKNNKQVTERDNTKNGLVTGNTIYFGSRTSNVFLRIYRKDLQEGIVSKVEKTRVEIEFKNEKAREVADLIIRQDLTIFYKVLNNYIRFVDKGKDSNKSRWKTSRFWADFMKSVEKIKLGKEPKQRNYNDLMSWLDRQVATTLAILDIVNQEDIEELKKRGYERLKNKHLKIINDSMISRETMKID